MSTTFERAPKAIEAMVQKAMESYQPQLHKEGVTIDTIIARRTTGTDEDTEDVHALFRSGYPIDAKIQVTSLVDRARGIADAKLTIDGLEWNKATDRQRAALIDHELEHLVLKEHKPTKKDPAVYFMKDDPRRPVLKVRPHDWMLAGFRSVAERHGQNSHEAMQFAAFRDEFGQLNMFGPSTIQIADGTNGKKKIAATKETTGDVLDLSRACARRHHAECKYDKCQCQACDCYATKKENRANA